MFWRWSQNTFTWSILRGITSNFPLNCQASTFNLLEYFGRPKTITNDMVNNLMQRTMSIVYLLPWKAIPWNFTVQQDSIFYWCGSHPTDFKTWLFQNLEQLFFLRPLIPSVLVMIFLQVSENFHTSCRYSILCNILTLNLDRKFTTKEF